MLIEKLKTDFVHNDERGSLTQLVHKGYSQFNIITSKAGVFRGGHFHKLNTEAFFVISGKCKVTARKDNESENMIFSAGDFFRIGPYVCHDFDYIEDTVMASMYSLGVELDNDQKDIYTLEQK